MTSSPTLPWARHSWVPLALILGLGFAIRAAALFIVEPTHLAGDEIAYFRRGVALARGEGISPAGVRPPALEVVNGALFALFGASKSIARAGSVVFGTAALFPIYLLGVQLGGRRVGLTSAAVAALYPNLIAFSHYVFTESLFILLATSAIAGLLSQKARPHWIGPPAIGVLLAAATLTRSVGIAFVPFAIAWLACIRRGHPRRALWATSSMFLAFALTILPWTVYINRGSEEFVLLGRTTWMNLYIGNGVSVESPHGGETLDPWQHYWTLGADVYESEPAARKLATQAIRERLPWWPFEKTLEVLPGYLTPNSFAVRRLLMAPEYRGPDALWAYRFRGETLNGRPARNAMVAWTAASYAIVAVLGLGGLILAPRTSVTGLFGLFLGSQFLLVVATFASTRFRLPSMVLLLVTASWCLLEGRRGWTQASPKRRRASAAVMAVTLLIIASRLQDAMLYTLG